MVIDSKTAFIWDLDGTLIDSYPVIVSALHSVSLKHGVGHSREYINKFCIDTTVGTYLDFICKETRVERKTLSEEYHFFSEEKKDEIVLIKNAYEILDALKSFGASNYLYTHRGLSTYYLIEKLKIREFFTETLTAENHFPLKPKGDAVRFLVDKYNLIPEKTFYVGDRTIDMDCARDAGVKGILYLPEDSYCEQNGVQDYTVNDLMSIIEL